MLSLNNQEGDSWDILFYKAFHSWWIRSAFEKGTLIHTLLWTRSSWHQRRGICTNNPLIWDGGGKLWLLCFKGYQWHKSKAMLCKKLGTQPTSSSSIASLEASLSVLLWVWTYIRSSQLNQWGEHKWPLHFYSADQRLTVKSFMGCYAREAPGSWTSSEKAHPAPGHVAPHGWMASFWGKMGALARV